MGRPFAERKATIMFPSLETKLKRYEQLEQMLQDPAVLADPTRMVETQREYGGLRRVAEPVREFHRLEAEIAGTRELAENEADPETREYARGELKTLTARRDV